MNSLKVWFTPECGIHKPSRSVKVQLTLINLFYSWSKSKLWYISSNALKVRCGMGEVLFVSLLSHPRSNWHSLKVTLAHIGTPLNWPALKHKWVQKFCRLLKLHGCESFKGVKISWVWKVYGCESFMGVKISWVWKFHGCENFMGMQVSWVRKFHGVNVSWVLIYLGYSWAYIIW